ncbi:MAG: hypothetical protein MEQ74_08350 [Paracoccus sp.]|nr:hypothetical protein [Paracoccus sp. (in: a-proteobacteria)]
MNAEDSDKTTGHADPEAAGPTSQLADAVMDRVARKGDDLRSQLAGRVDDLAASLRQAGSEGRPDSHAAGLFDRAADTVSDLADSLGSGDPRQVLDDVRAFARRQPGAFLGISALAGFAAARFLSAGSPAASPADSRRHADPAGAPAFASTAQDAPIDGGHHA